MGAAVGVSSGTGWSIAADPVVSAGTTDWYQQVKIADGTPGNTGGVGVTTGVPGATATGLQVAVIPGASVSIQGGVSVTIQQGASVSIGSAVQVTVVTQLGTQVVSVVPGLSVSIPPNLTVVSTVVTLLGTVNVNLAAAGTTIPVNVVAGGAAPGTTATTQTNVTAQVVWLAPTQTMAVVSTVATVLGTVAVNVVAGGAAPGTTVTTQTAIAAQLVWFAPTQTVHVTIDAGAGGGGSVTTAGPSVTATGQVVWVAGGQSVQQNPVWVSGSVTAIIVFPAVQTVAISSIVPVTTQTSVSVSGVPVWFNPGALVSLSGTGIVSVVPGVSVSAVVSGTVQVLGAAGVTTQTSVSVTGVPVWFAPGALVSLSGTGVVSIVPGVSVNVQAGVSVTVVTQLGTQVVSVVPGVSVLASITASAVLGTVVAVSGVTAVSAVSTVVTVLGTQVVTLATGGSVAALDVGRTQVLLDVTITSVGISGTTVLFTAYQGGTQLTAGVGLITVPAGKTFRVLGMALVAQNSVTTSPAFVNVVLLQSTATPTWTSTVPVAGVVGVGCTSAGAYNSAWNGGIADVAAGATIGVGVTIGTSGATIVQCVVQGYLFP